MNSNPKGNVLNKIESAIERIPKIPAGAVKKPAAEIGYTFTDMLREDLIESLPGEMSRQIFGVERSSQGKDKKPDAKDVISQEEKAKKIIHFERRIAKEEKELAQKRQRELQIEIQSIQYELSQIISETKEMSEEVRITAIQAQATLIESSAYSVYDKFFFLNFLKDIVRYKKRIKSAKVWLKAHNRRVQKGWLANYKKYGAKYLLSGEHFLSRSAG